MAGDMKVCGKIVSNMEKEFTLMQTVKKERENGLMVKGFVGSPKLLTKKKKQKETRMRKLTLQKENDSALLYI